eukprot:9659053-Alexandrium_andersonii.AAC.1
MFKGWASQKHLPLDSDDAVDTAMAKYCESQFLAGDGAHVGERLIAAWLFHHPDFSRHGRSHLVRMSRTLKGWRRLCPGRMR